MLVLLPILIYIFLFIPYLSLIPANDGGLEFMFADQWFLGKDILHILSLHPPLKMILFSSFFTLFGFQHTSLIGLIFGIAGIVSLYYIAKKLFDTNVAILSALLLALSGLFLSVGVFGIHDFLMTVLVLAALAFYLNEKYIGYAIFASLAVLTKETAIFFTLSILFSSIYTKRKLLIEAILPFIAFGWYFEFVHVSGNHLWNDWNFSTTAKSGSFYTIIYNIVTLHIFNKYAYENMLHLFIFNFNWVFWIFAVLGIVFLRKGKLQENLLPIFLYFFLYSITILTFQTFTITRYVLPLLPFVYLFASFGALNLRYKPVFATLLIIISLVSLSNSVDPISNMIWPKTQVLGESVYLNSKLDGADGITYNVQYLTMMKTRTDLLKSGDCVTNSLIKNDRDELAIFHVYNCKK